MRWLDGIMYWMDMSLSNFWKLVMDREGWHAAVPRVSESEMTEELKWTELNNPVYQLTRAVMSDSATPWTAAFQASLAIINSWSLLKLISTESVMPSNHLILCCSSKTCVLPKWGWGQG